MSLPPGINPVRAVAENKEDNDNIKWTDQLAEELHKPVRRHFPTRRVFSKGIDQIWAIDLIDMQHYSKYNDGYKYLLAVIDVFSKFGWMRALKSKSGIDVTTAFKDILSTSHRKPELVWCDKGKEFYNKHFKSVVNIYSTQNESKSCIVERWNRSVKSFLFKYFSANNTYRYIDVLQQIIDRYNYSKHRSIKMTPVQASQPENEAKVYMTLYDEIIHNKRPRPVPKFSIGDKVRITKKQTVFTKGFLPRWSEELFLISSVQHTDPITYKIKDLNGEEIQGTFYEQELQKSHQDTFRIEKVIRTKGDKLFVKWKGYSNDFNSWINKSDVVGLNP